MPSFLICQQAAIGATKIDQDGDYLVNAYKANEFSSLMEKAKIFHQNGDYDEEVNILEKAIDFAENEENILTVYIKLSECYSVMGSNESAEEYLLKAAIKTKDLPEKRYVKFYWLVQSRLGDIYYNKGDYQNALKCKMEAYRYIDHLKSNDAFMILMPIGINLENLQNFDEALRFYEKANSLPNISKEDMAMIHTFMGQCYDKKGDEKSAYECFNRAFSNDPNYDSGWSVTFRYAELSYYLKKYNSCIEFGQKVLEKIPDSEKNFLQAIYQYLGYSFLEMKKFKEGERSLLNAIKIDSPRSNIRKAGIYEALAECLYNMNKKMKALDYCHKALKEEHDKDLEEKICYIMAIIYFSRNDTKRYKQCKNRILELNSKSPLVTRLIGFEREGEILDL